MPDRRPVGMMRLMPDDSFKEFVLDQLAELPGVRARAMFGAYGLYQGQNFFGILDEGRLFFKTDTQSKADYLARGMGPFTYESRGRVVTMGFHEVPLDVLETAPELVAWARRAISLAAASKNARPWEKARTRELNQMRRRTMFCLVVAFLPATPTLRKNSPRGIAAMLALAEAFLVRSRRPGDEHNAFDPMPIIAQIQANWRAWQEYRDGFMENLEGLDGVALPGHQNQTSGGTRRSLPDEGAAQGALNDVMTSKAVETPNTLKKNYAGTDASRNRG